MSSSDRQDLIRNAVTFLQDPKTQTSPLTQRIQFLEAKGLTPAEIDQAVRQASASTPAQSYVPSYGPLSYPPQPRPYSWDWRDYFVTTVISGTIVYGAVSLFKKYLLPHLQPPMASAYEEDKDALNAQFDAAEALLKEIQDETAAVRVAVEEQKTKIDQTTQDVEAVVNEMRQAESRTRDEIREIREEVNNIREMLPKMVDRNKEHHTQSLNELQQEVKSLKTLLLNRPTGMPSSPNPAAPIARPSIPAWQLGGSSTTTNSPGVLDLPAAETSLPISEGNGKRKEVDTNTVSLPSS